MVTKGLRFILTMAALLSLSALMVEAAPTDANPTAKVTIKVTQVAAGLGVTWGDGILTYKGKEYKFKVSGLNLVALGMSSINAKGDVYNLQNLDDFSGKYFGVEAGATLVKGSAGLVLRNTKGVMLNLQSNQEGAELRLGNEGLSISPAWE